MPQRVTQIRHVIRIGNTSQIITNGHYLQFYLLLILCGRPSICLPLYLKQPPVISWCLNCVIFLIYELKLNLTPTRYRAGV
jgi:hypothetical protein